MADRKIQETDCCSVCSSKMEVERVCPWCLSDIYAVVLIWASTEGDRFVEEYECNLCKKHFTLDYEFHLQEITKVIE